MTDQFDRGTPSSAWRDIKDRWLEIGERQPEPGQTDPIEPDATDETSISID